MKHHPKGKEESEKKQEKSGIWKKTYKTFFDVPTWIGYEHIKQTHQSLWGAVKGNFKVKKAKRKETFEQAMYRLNLSEEDLKQRHAFNQKMLILFGVTGVLGIMYSVYLVWYGHTLGGIVALGVTVFLFVRAFSYSFWNFQIKHRKLGCTFREWWRGKVDENLPDPPRE